MLNILVLTFYYEPDLCAGSFRATAYVKALSKKLGKDDKIDVVTTMPNRYHTYDKTSSKIEKSGNVTIRRIELPYHESGMLDQSRAFFNYAKNVIQTTKGKKYDVVFATSSRLFTAFLGALISRYVKARLYLDLRDIFTDTLSDILNRKLALIIVPIFRIIEKFTVRSASKINLVSEGFRDYFSTMQTNHKFTYFTNGIDDDFLNVDFSNSVKNSKAVILYAGNIGEGQGLEHIIPDVAKRMENEAEFWVIGAGGRKNNLEIALKLKKVSNVKIIDPVDRKKVIEYYSQCDYLFLHLNDHEAFKKVLPSKIFEYAATGKPIIAGVNGYSRKFLTEHVTNCSVFDPCSSDGFIEKYRMLTSKTERRVKFVRKFGRSHIMDQLADDTMQLVN